MDHQLRRLIDAVWEHNLPLGPFGDLDYRMRVEREWEDSLTVEDCLALLGWIECPRLPPHWTPAVERWLPGLVTSAASYVGRAGQRLGDTEILHQFLELLAQPHCREVALEGLGCLASPAAFDSLLCLLVEDRSRIGVCLALAACATPDQIAFLGMLSWSAPTEELRKAAAQAAFEGGIFCYEQGIECDPAPTGDAPQACPDHAAWRTGTVLALTRLIEESGDFSSMPILADALQDAGCDNEVMLSHCRCPGPHMRGCWAVASLLGNE